jgi:hypothetical protein
MRNLGETAVLQSHPIYCPLDAATKKENHSIFRENLRLGGVNNRFESCNDLFRSLRKEDSGASYNDIASYMGRFPVNLAEWASRLRCTCLSTGIDCRRTYTSIDLDVLVGESCAEFCDLGHAALDELLPAAP